MALDEPREDEVATAVNGIDVLISDEIRSYAERSTVDFLTGPYRQGFIIGINGYSGC